MITLGYEYHDSNLVDATYGPRREVSFVFDLCPIFYSEKSTVTLRLGGIFNDESAKNFVVAINEKTKSDDDYRDRCDIIQLDTKKPSKEGDIYLFLELGYYGHIRIHCQHLSEIVT